MKEKLFFRKLKFFAVIILPFAIIACNRTNPAPSMPAASPQTTAALPVVSEQVIEAIEMPEETEGPFTQEYSLSATNPMSVGDAMRLFDPITEIEMVFVEGGTMVIQGREISLDSFYISKFVLNTYFHNIAHNWATNRGYNTRSWIGVPPSPLNTMMSWGRAIAVSNWLSIMEGLTPVYWRIDRTVPILAPWEVIDFVNGGDPIFHPHFFYIDWDANGYRLPTEAEWEFAARGGNMSRGYRYAGSNTLADILTNFIDDDFTDMFYIPGQMLPNELGIHDMSGQAAEWVLGPWTEYGELEPSHNPGQISIFDFARPFALIQKGGTRVMGNESFRPGYRIWHHPDWTFPDHDRNLDAASVRLVRRGGFCQTFQEELAYNE